MANKIIKRKEKGMLIVLSGPSGCGKDTVAKKLLENNKNIWLSVSCTSRNKRGNEEEGVDYFFVTKEEFEEKIKNGELLEYAEYNECYYGTPKDKVIEKLNEGKDVLLIIEVEGALKIKNLFPESVCIFILPPSMKELQKRLITRGTEDKEKIFKRFKKAYKEINEMSKYNYVVVNDNINEAALDINSIITSEKLRVDRIEEVYLGTIEEELHEDLMDFYK